jgi:hypothetical protein
MNKNRQAQFTVGHCGSNSSTGYSWLPIPWLWCSHWPPSPQL